MASDSTPITPPHRAPRVWSRRALRYLSTLLLLEVAVHLLLPQLTTLEHSLGVLKAMNWWMVALAVGA